MAVWFRDWGGGWVGSGGWVGVVWSVAGWRLAKGVVTWVGGGVLLIGPLSPRVGPPRPPVWSASAAGRSPGSRGLVCGVRVVGVWPVRVLCAGGGCRRVGASAVVDRDSVPTAVRPSSGGG